MMLSALHLLHTSWQQNGLKTKLQIIDPGHSTFEIGIAHALMAALDEI